MQKYKNKYNIKSNRLKNWDYGNNASYFITICTKYRYKSLGYMQNNKILLSKIGKIAEKHWKQIPKHFPFVILDKFVIMPDHLHGIIIINKQIQNKIYKSNKFGPQSENLASIIRGFKASIKKYAVINHIRFNWQTLYYERKINNITGFIKTRNYIIHNPEIHAKRKRQKQINTFSKRIK